MDIKKLATYIDDSQASGKSQHTAGPRSINVSDQNKSDADKVSLDGYHFKKNEVLFARSEYDKQHHEAFEKVKAFKAKLTEFEQAKNTSPTSAHSTELGKMLNDPEVWEQIARKMLE
ncbi:MAG: hypothetical protein WD097_03185 [Balneolales bacterium]